MQPLPEDNPAPNAYYPREFSRPQSAITVKSRYPLVRPQSFTPAPNAYDPYNSFTTKTPPAFSFAGRPDIAKVKNGNPGPGYYELAESSIYRRNGISMASRYEKLLKNETPGPNQYQQEKPNFTRGKPGITIKSRTTAENASRTPGPGSYDIPSAIEKKAHGAAIRPETVRVKIETPTPGPGSYSTDYSRFRRTNGGATIKGRYNSKVGILEV